MRINQTPDTYQVKMNNFFKCFGLGFFWCCFGFFCFVCLVLGVLFCLFFVLVFFITPSPSSTPLSPPAEGGICGRIRIRPREEQALAAAAEATREGESLEGGGETKTGTPPVLLGETPREGSRPFPSRGGPG